MTDYSRSRIRSADSSAAMETETSENRLRECKKDMEPPGGVHHESAGRYTPLERKMEKKPVKLIANNKKAYHDYFIEEKYEAGISWPGPR